MDTAKLQDILKRICQPGRGILAADESSGTIKKRFDSIGIEDSEENHRRYRNMLFEAEGVEENISGVILYDETVDQQSDGGIGFPELLDSKSIVPGIKVDTGKADHPKHAPQTLTHGLENLAERLQSYTKRSNGTLGFTKWRQVILVEPNPEDSFLEESMDAMARYAKICNEQGYIPITEPEVLMDGTHTLEQCKDVTERTLKALYKKLKEHGVDPALTLLKPNMVLSGKDCKKDTPEEVAAATVEAFQNSVPATVPGIVFLSGGQTPEQATENLNAIALLAQQKGLAGLPVDLSPEALARGEASAERSEDGLPAVASAERSEGWWISYSYGRALQEYALKAWAGDNANNSIARAALLKRAKLNGAAQLGKYAPLMESEVIAV